MATTERLVVWRYIWMRHEKTITIPNLTSFDTFCFMIEFVKKMRKIKLWNYHSHQTVIRRTSDGHQTVIGQFQKIIRLSLNCHQTVIYDFQSCITEMVFFVTKIVLTYFEKKVFYWSRKTSLEQNLFKQWKVRRIRIQIGKNYWDLETCRKS